VLVAFVVMQPASGAATDEELTAGLTNETYLVTHP
jgi:hypothetical protein